MALGSCDDCAHGCRDGCAFVRPNEQPYFQAYRLAHRLTGDDWATWDFVAWIQRQWTAFGVETGTTERQRGMFPDQFRAWLFARVQHPEAA